MTDREFVKLNTSIQTASNSDTIHEEEDGTIPAVIELRLPDNIFNSQSGNRKIDSVSMLTTKLRLSMLETPIAQIPLDETLSNEYNTHISQCKLDVYPWVVDDQGNLLPTPEQQQTNIAFPTYKQHKIVFRFRVCISLVPERYETLFDFVECNSNDIFNQFPQTSRFYQLMTENNLLGNHLMNMVIPETYEKLKIENNVALVKNISTLEQMWHDALENAITYAATGTEQTVLISLIDTSIITSDMSPAPKTTPTVHIDEMDKDVCYWKNSVVDSSVNEDFKLKHACKPDITFNNDAMTFSYDTVAFGPMVPVFWSNSFIENFETSDQQLVDSYRKEALMIPPPKRVYRYSVNTEGEPPSVNYSFGLEDPLDAKVFNIIANKATRDTFPFLPWLTLSPSLFSKYTTEKTVYKIYRETDTKDSGTIETCHTFSNPQSSEITLYYDNYDPTNNQYEYSAGWINDSQTYPRIPIPPYLAIYLETNYPLNDPSVPVPPQVVMAVDFFYPEDDPGYLSTGNIANTNPDDRYAQMLILPFSPLGYNSTPSITRDANLIGPGRDINWTITSTPYENILTPQITAVSFSSENLTTGKTLIEQSETPVTTTTNYYSYPDITENWAFYYHGGIPTNPATLEIGTPIRGNWVTTQTFRTPNQPPAFDTIYANAQTEAFRHLPPWVPDATVESAETTTINDKTYKRGSLIWIIYDRSYPDQRGDKTYVTDGALASHFFQVIQKSTTTTVYNVIELFEHLTNAPNNMIYPNLLENETEEIFLLNGASADMTIGPQEVIQTSDELFTITDTISTIPRFRSINEEFIFNYMENTEYYMRQRGEKRGIFDASSGILLLAYTYYINPNNPLIKESEGIRYGDVSGSVFKNEPKQVLETTYGEWGEGRIIITTNTFESNDLTYTANIGEGNERIFENKTSSIRIERVDAEAIADQAYYIAFNPSTNRFEQVSAIKINDANDYIPSCEPIDIESIPDPITGNVFYRHLYRLLDDGNKPNFLYYENCKRARCQKEETETTTRHSQVVSLNELNYEGNVRLTWEWKNIPTVILSPIQSFVLVLNGMNVNQEIQPINISQPGSSSLTSSIPIIENYYSLASTLRDLHDELVVVKDSYSDSAFYKLDTTSGQERTITLTAKYITKDGRMHQVYIPKNGVFTLQLTFGINYYLA